MLEHNVGDSIFVTGRLVTRLTNLNRFLFIGNIEQYSFLNPSSQDYDVTGGEIEFFIGFSTPADPATPS